MNLSTELAYIYKNMSTELVSEKKSLSYFMTNYEYRNLPENSDFVLHKIHLLKKSLFLFLTQFLQNFFFFMICKSGDSYLYLTGLMTFIIMTGVLTILSKKVSPAKSKTSLAFIGLLDVIYYFILLSTGHHINSFVFATQLQGTLTIRVFLIKFILSESFRFVQYFSAIIILVATILNYSYFGDRYTYLLLLGIVLHCINNIIKRHYLKKFQVDALAMNKYSSLFATGFGIIFIPLLGLITDDDIGTSLEQEILCLVGIKCLLMPVYVIALLASNLAHQFILRKTLNEIEGHKIVYMFSSITAFLGFYVAELALEDETSNLIAIICVVLACIGSILYHSYPEIPQKFSYSDN